MSIESKTALAEHAHCGFVCNVARLARQVDTLEAERDAALAELAAARAEVEPPPDMRCGTFGEIAHTPRMLEKERDAALADVASLKSYNEQLFRERNALAEVRQRGCDCSDDDACLFARQRDAALERVAELSPLRDALTRVIRERDHARANARILAHCYENDNRPPGSIVRESLAYPVKA